MELAIIIQVHEWIETAQFDRRPPNEIHVRYQIAGPNDLPPTKKNKITAADLVLYN